MPLDSIYKFKINKMASKYKMAYSEVLSVMPQDGIYKFKINMMAAYSEVLSVMSEDGIYKFKIKKMASKQKMAYSEVLGVMPEDSVGVHVLVDLPAGVLHTGGEGRGPACEHPYLASEGVALPDFAEDVVERGAGEVGDSLQPREEGAPRHPLEVALRQV